MGFSMNVNSRLLKKQIKKKKKMFVNGSKRNVEGPLWELLIPFWSVNKHGHHRQFLFLIGRFLKQMFVNDRDKMSNLYRGPPIDASYQVSVHLAKRFQKSQCCYQTIKEQCIYNSLSDHEWWPWLPSNMAVAASQTWNNNFLFFVTVTATLDDSQRSSIKIYAFFPYGLIAFDSLQDFKIIF
jgi:hypothetical protein